MVRTQHGMPCRMYPCMPLPPTPAPGQSCRKSWPWFCPPAVAAGGGARAPVRRFRRPISLHLAVAVALSAPHIGPVQRTYLSSKQHAASSSKQQAAPNSSSKQQQGAGSKQLPYCRVASKPNGLRLLPGACEPSCSMFPLRARTTRVRGVPQPFSRIWKLYTSERTRSR